MILNIFLICFIIVTITDLSGITESFKTPIAKILSRKTKTKIMPESINLPTILICSSCQCWWASLFYVTITGNISIFNIFICALAFLSAPHIKGLILLIREFLIYLENKSYKSFEKL